MRRQSNNLWWMIIIAALALTLASVPVYAQETIPLRFGIPVEGTINVPETDIPRFHHAYTFYGRSIHYEYGITYTNTGTSPIQITLTMEAIQAVVLDVRVEPGDSGGQGRLLLPQTGEYILVIAPLDDALPASYSLTILEADTPAPPPQTTLTGGVSVTLTWRAGADLNLELRDPVGGEIHRRNPVSPNARYSGDQTCVSTAPSEDITWLAGEMPVGVYEILIVYGVACEGSPSIDYTLTIRTLANGAVIDTITSTISSGETGIAQFEVTENGDVRAGFVIGGLATGEAAEISSVPLRVPQMLMYYAQPFNLAAGGADGTITLTGYISNNAPYTVHQFDGVEGDVITLEANRTSGSLDTLLIVTDRYQQPEYFFFNDDAAPPFAASEGARTDSALREFQLPYTGTYYVAVTRYGQEYGGTEGRFTLVLRRESPQES